MRLLVTGGMGFIGSNFILLMLEKYHDLSIVNLDLLTYAGNKENLAHVANESNYSFVHGDIADGGLLDQIMKEGIDAVIHFAAESHVDRSIKEPGLFLRTNAAGTLHLLDAARRHAIKRFIQISTDEVYGSLGPGGFFTEETCLSPNSPYAASKAGADFMACSYYRTYGLPVIITRCSNNYGPRQHLEKFIPLLTTNALLDRKIPIYGDGRHIRDWLFVEDHCHAIDCVLRKGQPGEIYNIGGNQEYANVDIARRILGELGKPQSLLEFVEDRPGHDQRYAMDASKIHKELGWRAAFTFDQGLRRTLDWYMKVTGGGSH
ncbi:MAG TPA: dTDP-glucose 4,6-dehydratase [Bacilli bacterium]